MACFQGKLLATSCSVPPPCARIRSDSMLFVGIVTDPGVVAAVTNDELVRDVRLRVDEVLAGAVLVNSEVIVATQGSWLERGHSYLIDAAGTDNGRFVLRICGASGEITSEPIAGILEYLRQRRQGKTRTSLTINVTSGDKSGIDWSRGDAIGSCRSCETERGGAAVAVGRLPSIGRK